MSSASSQREFFPLKRSGDFRGGVFKDSFFFFFFEFSKTLSDSCLLGDACSGRPQAEGQKGIQLLEVGALDFCG